MTREPAATYPPLNTLKPVADDVWIVDGPTIEFGMPWPKMPFPTRMTVIRLGGDDLFIHSPTPLTRELMAEVEAIGTPRWIIGPNRIHYWWIPEWHEVFPGARVYLAPRIREQADGRIDFATLELDQPHGYPWDHAIAGQAAKDRIEQITSDVEPGRIYEGKVAKIMDFGAFVTIAPGKDGLVHVSQISNERVEKVGDKLREGDVVKVKVLEVDKQGRIRLSMKAVEEGEGV